MARSRGSRSWEKGERGRAAARVYRRRLKGCINPTGEVRSGACPICRREGPLVFDHCHSTGLFRGWICMRCNSGLGHFFDDPLSLLRAVEYLQRELERPKLTANVDLERKQRRAATIALRKSLDWRKITRWRALGMSWETIACKLDVSKATMLIWARRRKSRTQRASDGVSQCPESQTAFTPGSG